MDRVPYHISGLRGLDSPELTLQDDTIFGGTNVIQRQMTSFDRPSWILQFFKKIKK